MPKDASQAEPSLPEKIIALDQSLRRAKLPHAFGGELAFAYYAEPNLTIHIDLHVFVYVERWDEVVDALTPLDIETEGIDSSALERDRQYRLNWGNGTVNLFFAYDEIHDEMRKQARRVPFADTTLPILAPEHLAVCKAMFDRPRDWLDIEQMLVATDDLDVPEIEGWLARMVDESDPRVQRFAELKEKVL